MMADEEVTPQYLSDVASNNNISADWKKLASHLDSKMFTGGTIRNFEQQNQGDIFMQTKLMLETWHNCHARSATLGKLIKAIVKCGYTKDAETIFGVPLVTQNTPSGGGSDTPDGHSKPSDARRSENTLDVVVVTAVSIEFQAVKKVLVKGGCTSFTDFQIRDSSDEVLVGGVATKLQSQESTFNVGVFCLLQMGHEGATDFLQAIKYGVESKQVSESGISVMIGMCAGNPDSKVKVGTIMTPQLIANETGVGSKQDAKTGKFETSAADAKVSHRVCRAVQAASPESCGYKWLDKYLPNEVKNTPSPLFLQDAILAALNKVHPSEMNVTKVHRELLSTYENWPKNMITKEVVKEALGILTGEYVTEDDKKFSINEKGRKCIKDIESDSDFPRSDSQDPKVNKDPMISGAVVRVGMTDSEWEKLKDQAAQRKASGFDMEGYGYLSYAEKHLGKLTTCFVKVVTDYATKESKMDYYQDYGACLAAAFFLHVLEKNAYLAGVAGRK